MEKETVLILLLLKPITKTSQLNDKAIMIYHSGIPVLKISIPFFAIILSHERHENKREIVLLLKTMTKTCQLNGKSKEEIVKIASFYSAHILSTWCFTMLKRKKIISRA